MVYTNNESSIGCSKLMADVFVYPGNGSLGFVYIGNPMRRSVTYPSLSLPLITPIQGLDKDPGAI